LATIVSILQFAFVHSIACFIIQSSVVQHLVVSNLLKFHHQKPSFAMF